ncbi:MAG: SirB2 family protein [Ktedonobacteraceae bacterium]|nr:SirB2 family protein [Ktedonobacteraceae bacterium]
MSWLFTVVKFIHILLAIIAFGFNATYALWLVRAQQKPEHLDFALRGVKILDDYFANPAYLLLLVSGLTMVLLSGYTLTTFWLLAALILWVVAIALGYGVYTPTLSRQIRVLAAAGHESEEFRALSTRGSILGIILAVLVLLILVLMVFKPTF